MLSSAIDWKIYPVVNDQKNYIELTQGDLNVIPPIIQFYVCADDSRILAAHKKIQKTIKWFVDENILKQFGLKLFISVRSHKGGKYPLQQIFAVYQYDRDKFIVLLYSCGDISTCGTYRFLISQLSIIKVRSRNTNSSVEGAF